MPCCLEAHSGDMFATFHVPWLAVTLPPRSPNLSSSMHRSKHIAAVATELFDEQKYPPGGGLATRPVDGITPPLTYRDASLRMWTDGCKVVSSALWALGRSAKTREQLVLPNGRSMTQRELYVEAIRLDGQNARAYCSLACTLADGESIMLPDGRSLRKKDLFLEAIRRDVSYGAAYGKLGYTLPIGGSVALPDGRSLTKRELYLEALPFVLRTGGCF
jgi:hypothetical protein